MTDFGEARATDLNHTMTSVGTPIFVAPEVMRGDRYDKLADSYSFGICLVAMIRAEKHLMEFYMECLRKSMKRKTQRGVGMSILNNRVYNKGWRPLLPISFVRSYPKLTGLIKSCWSAKVSDRPNFDEIVGRFQGDIGDEVRRGEEPLIVLMGEEEDEVYQGRMERGEEEQGKEENGGGGAELDAVRKAHSVEMQGVMMEMQNLRDKLKALQAGVTKTVETGEEVEPATTTRRVEKDKGADDEMAGLVSMMGR